MCIRDRSSGPCVRRRPPRTWRHAVLHEFGVTSIRTARSDGRGRLWGFGRRARRAAERFCRRVRNPVPVQCVCMRSAMLTIIPTTNPASAGTTQPRATELSGSQLHAVSSHTSRPPNAATRLAIDVYKRQISLREMDVAGYGKAGWRTGSPGLLSIDESAC